MTRVQVKSEWMRRVSVSRFRATCLAVLRRVQRTGRPVLITRFGEPVAAIIPSSRLAAHGAWLGSMVGRATIVGDVVGPALEPRAWRVLR
jgi:prevent-host-death family protein